MSNLAQIHITPVTGFLDTRSTPDEVPFGGYRLVENMEVSSKLRLCRSSGFRRLLADATYNNQDLHDQLFNYTRQHITFGLQCRTLAGFSKLIVGTQNRLYALNVSSGNWVVISDLLGGDAGANDRRWRGALVNNTVVLTNDFDPVQYHVIDQPPIEANNQSVAPIQDLHTLKITRASCVVAWENFIFLANMVADGAKTSNRVVWSDYKRPLSFIPNPSQSLAGSFDLDSGDTILAMLPLVDRLIIYASRSIWEAVATGDEEAFRFTCRYRAPNGTVRCIAYPNTLVSIGSEHFYWGADGIYKYSLYDPQPVLVDWIHRASAAIFDDIERGLCQVHVGAYHSARKTIYWSWAREGETIPGRTFCVNTEFPFSSFLDYGASMCLNWFPSNPLILRDWILDNCICTRAEMEEYGEGLIKEGGNCRPVTDPACPTRPTSFFNQTELVDGDVTSEDYLGTADADSLYARLGNTSFEDLCAAQMSGDECSTGELFIFASPVDKCLKEFTSAYYREYCLNNEGCGTYGMVGYKSLLRTGAMNLNDPDHAKVLNRFSVEPHPVPVAVPSLLKLRIGTASHAVDPNTAEGRCVIMWEEQDQKPLDCQSDVDMATHRQDWTVPNDQMEWGIYQVGRYVYFELEIVNPNVSPPDTGGAVCFSRYTFDVVKEQRRRG